MTAPKKEPKRSPKQQEPVADQEQVEEHIEVVEKPERVEKNIETVDLTEKSKVFTASQGRLRKLLSKSGLSGRIAKDVFDMLDKKIKTLVEQRVKNLAVKDKKILYEENEEKKPDKTEKSYELPINPFREYIKSVIKKEHDISRVPPDVVETIHHLVEKDIVRVCQYAQDNMKHSSRKTLFVGDIDLASKNYFDIKSQQ